ncbi:MAG: hypothetical protein PHQ47_01620 [Candidatus Portnoybacteria bacterium]|nr:hypothetical protein [Candidatus Portnoybacteria bacterium]
METDMNWFFIFLSAIMGFGFLKATVSLAFVLGSTEDKRKIEASFWRFFLFC